MSKKNKQPVIQQKTKMTEQQRKNNFSAAQKLYNLYRRHYRSQQVIKDKDGKIIKPTYANGKQIPPLTNEQIAQIEELKNVIKSYYSDVKVAEQKIAEIQRKASENLDRLPNMQSLFRNLYKKNLYLALQNEKDEKYKFNVSYDYLNYVSKYLLYITKQLCKESISNAKHVLLGQIKRNTKQQNRKSCITSKDASAALAIIDPTTSKRQEEVHKLRRKAKKIQKTIF